MNQKSGRESGRGNPGDIRFLSRTDIRYWQSKLYKEIYREEGRRREIEDWSARIQHARRRERFNLGTPNKAEAANKARDIYRFLVANGWQQTIEKFKLKKAPVKKMDITIGSFIDAVKRTGDAQSKTLDGYAADLRKIAADIAGIPHGRGGARARRLEWRAKVDAMPLSFLTPDKIQRWKIDYVAKSGQDPVRQRSSRITANSCLRCAKSLFSERLRRHVQIDLSGINPFDGVDFYKRTSMKYRSDFDVLALINDAQTELFQAEPEQAKIFLLAVMAGLRRREIDTLEWTAFHWDEGIIRIEPTRYFYPKSEDSIGDVEVDAELLAVFRGFREQSLGPFVVRSSVKPRLDVVWEHYRCTSIFENLIRWLRKKGVAGNNPLHTLRKEFGSLINDAHGIYAASRSLRHADIATTVRHYIDKRRKITSGLGRLLLEEKNAGETRGTPQIRLADLSTKACE